MEIENTHNFIANGIVAHNTYISRNMGVGTTAPYRRLQVNGTGGVSLEANESVYLATASGQNVGVRTTSPSAVLHVAGSSTENALNVNGTFIINGTTGNVGIGTTSPGSRLEVENTAVADDVLLLEDSSGLCEAQPTTTGLTWSCSSDIRLKTNVRSASDVLGYIAGIPLKDYTVVKTGENATGPIAQDLIAYPELVRIGDDGYYQVSELSQWTLVKSIQELKADNDALKSENSALKSKLDNLESRIAKLEAGG